MPLVYVGGHSKAHGGGRRCEEKGCAKSARGATAFCIAHGGGKRCQNPACDRSAQVTMDSSGSRIIP
jgi:hypothetical protein